MRSRLFKTRHAFEAFVASRRPEIYSVLVLHDNACSPSRCTCKPWFEVRDGTVENFQEGARLQAKWIKESSS